MRGVISGKGVQKAYLGVRYASITPDIQSEYKLPVKSGAYINGGSESTIEKDGPADKAGIKSGDIITKINDKNVGEDGSLSTLVSEFLPGETVKVTVLRNNKELVLDLVLGAYEPQN